MDGDNDDVNDANDASASNLRGYVFGSSTPRQFSYMERVEPVLQIYDAKIWPRRSTSRESRARQLAAFRQFMTEARHQSASPSTSSAFRRRGRSTEPSAHYRHRRRPKLIAAGDASNADETSDDDDDDQDFMYDTDDDGRRIRRRYDYEYVFGSSTPRKWSHMSNLPDTLKIYDVELFANLRRRRRAWKRRSRTVESSMVNADDASSFVKPIIKKLGNCSISDDADDERSLVLDTKKKKVVRKSEQASPHVNMHAAADQRMMLFFSEVASELDDSTFTEDVSLSNVTEDALDYAAIRSVVLSDDAIQFTNVRKSSILDNARLITKKDIAQQNLTVNADHML
uniref:Uncharacterized protein n=1 Tax=Romanomermis culicivorax TaxID=13658 RepID=A0A915I8B4_ROMCU